MFIVFLGLCLVCGAIVLVVGIFISVNEFFIGSQPGGKIAFVLMWMVGGIMVITFYYYKKKLDGMMG